MVSDIVYSITVPVYNGAATLYELCAQLLQVMHNHKHEIILVDDGSTDDSWEHIKKLSVQHGTVTGIRLQRNYGQYPATLCGLKYSSGNFCITIDDDLQHGPQYIAQLIEAQVEYSADVAYASFGKVNRALSRRIASSLFRWNARLLGYQPEATSFRLMNRTTVNALMDAKEQFLFIDAFLLEYTSSIAFVKVPHQKRMHGNSGYTFGKLIGLYLAIVRHHMLPGKRKPSGSSLLYTIISCTNDISKRAY